MQDDKYKYFQSNEVGFFGIVSRHFWLMFTLTALLALGLVQEVRCGGDTGVNPIELPKWCVDS
jgi:hypothetical protein